MFARHNLSMSQNVKINYVCLICVQKYYIALFYLTFCLSEYDYHYYITIYIVF